ncbi:hypothetical protein JCM33374_g6577 [Metschnikowia sp. JCM 33374]|nr:hypothetical protein JCM33374_g6577 [Metschnikowia sp. JCM 33374]
MVYSGPENGNFDFEQNFLTDAEWDYLVMLRDVLEVFRAPTIQLRGSSYPTIHKSVPIVCAIFDALQSRAIQEAGKENSLIDLGVKEATKKLTEYYPVFDESIASLKTLFIAIVLDPIQARGFRISRFLSDENSCYKITV